MNLQLDFIESSLNKAILKKRTYLNKQSKKTKRITMEKLNISI